MQVSKEELLHIANLARLNIDENEVDNYLKNLEDILNFANIVNKANVEGLDITIGANEAKNIFRKDEIKMFEDNEALLQNAINPEQNMFKIPKVIN
ncbi:MAG: Asp-tRNA(Asn)/Glu-tRNA(Gln) amidotransferase subunit GatC [Clostridia bacterium]|nr:Asp-tRNA(Asn)/Glu-tRNA(Gln) amidotransferase subunit GatC [Clostridia bacterium]